MEDLSSTYWNNRYLNDDFGWDLGSISPPIKSYIGKLTDKSVKILIPGAGNAYEAEYLFNNGFTNTFVLDFALEPLTNIKKRNPLFPENHLLQQDFFLHQASYDLIIEQTFFCAINPLLRKDYVSHMHQLLKPNGKLVGLLFDDILNTDKPPFGGTKKEYETLFSDKFNITILETAHNSVKPRLGRELFFVFEKI